MEITKAPPLEKNAAILVLGGRSSGKSRLVELLFGPNLTSARLTSGVHEFVVSCLGQNLVVIDSSASVSFLDPSDANDVGLVQSLVEETGYEPHLIVFAWRFSNLDAYPHAKIQALHQTFPDCRILSVFTFANTKSLPYPPGASATPPGTTFWSPPTPKQARFSRWLNWRNLHTERVKEQAGGWLTTCTIDNDPLCKVDVSGRKCLFNQVAWVPNLVGLVVAACQDYTWKDLLAAFGHSSDGDVLAAGHTQVQRRLKRLLNGVLSNHSNSIMVNTRTLMYLQQATTPTAAIAVAGMVGTGAVMGTAPALIVGGLVIGLWKGWDLYKNSSPQPEAPF